MNKILLILYSNQVSFRVFDSIIFSFSKTKILNIAPLWFKFLTQIKEKRTKLEFGKALGLSMLSIILYSCAQQVPLTGGDKDETAPIEKESLPLNGSVNFNSTTVVIEFDELIQLRNLKSQLIISPIIDPQPEITVKGKKLVVKLPDNLTPNTTYSFNFGNAIADITEYNPFLNYKYVFSTGSFLDSLSYSGTVVNAADLTPKEQVYVMLYAKDYDSIPYKELPNYVALTDENGRYEITNIAEGNYKVFALKDINNNYLFDLPNEEIAFKKELISLKISSSDNRLELFEEDNELQYVKKSDSKKYGEFKVAFNKPVDEISMELLGFPTHEGSFFIEGDEAQTNFYCWITDVEELKDIDLVFSDGNTIIDTVNFDVVPVDKLLDTVSIVSSNVSSNFDLNQNVVFSLKRPFASYEIDSIKFYEDSVLVPFVINDIALREFELAYDFKEDMKYQLFIPPGTFTDIYGLKNDTIFHQFKTKELSDYGTINLSLVPYFSENYILQLYRGKNLVDERFLSSAQKVEYKYLAPGDYTFKLFIDNNNNKKWDTGDYLKNLQPEKIIYYQKPIKIRSNWDNDIDWNIVE